MARSAVSIRTPARMFTWTIVCAVLVVLMALVRFKTFPEILQPFSYALPLLICIWNRSRVLLWSMAVAFLIMTTVRDFWFLPAQVLPQPPILWFLYISQCGNLLLTTVVLHLAINLHQRLESRNAALAQANDQLLRRESEIASKNAELQSQSVRLAEQNDKLQLQAAELEKQREQLRAKSVAQSALLHESHELQDELTRRRIAAEEAALRKTQFLAAVSHDIRTPANALTLLAELITRAASDPSSADEMPEMVRELQLNSRALVDLVSEVLDLTRFDAGRHDMNIATFSLRVLVETETKQLAPLADARNIQLRVDPSPEDLWLRTDRLKLARVLTNLISNAIKFTEVGSVTVRVERTADKGLAIRVIDTGVGISSQHQARIFDEFFQLRNPERDRTKGTGLGLAISKRLIDILGGRIDLTSEPGRGSTFTLVLPADLLVPAPESATMPPLVSPSTPASRLVGLQILLVEDHDTTRRATARLLEAEGGSVLQAADGQEALRCLHDEQVDVLLLDLVLPDMDGREILQQLRESRPSSLKCILAITGDVLPSRIEEVHQLGADAVITKPIQIDNVIHRLESVPRSKP